MDPSSHPWMHVAQSGKLLVLGEGITCAWKQLLKKLSLEL